MRFEIEYLIRDVGTRKIETRGKYKLLARDEGEARSNAIPVIAMQEETDRTQCFIEIIGSRELPLQEAYGLPDELVEFVDSGVLELLNEDIQERRIEFLIPAACDAGSPVRRAVDYKLVWHHPGNAPSSFDYEGSNFHLQQELDDLGTQVVPDTDTVDELLDWLDKFAQKPEMAAPGVTIRQEFVQVPDATEPENYFQNHGRIFCVPADILDELDPHLPPKFREVFRENCKRIIDPLVWTVEDLPDAQASLEGLIESGKLTDSAVEANYSVDDFDDAGEIEYAISRVNAALEERADYLTMEANKKHYYYECGGCGCYHPANWDGDCREDENRFASPEDMAERLGVELKDLEEVGQSDGEDEDEETTGTAE